MSKRTKADTVSGDEVLGGRLSQTDNGPSPAEPSSGPPNRKVLRTLALVVLIGIAGVVAWAKWATVSKRNREVTQDNLRLTRQRYEAGVTDSIEVVQSQGAVAAAELDYISSVFAHNVAKLSLARALGGAADKAELFLKLK